MKKFKPKPGQIDYTNTRWAPVINCVLQYKNKILILKRSDKLSFYPGRWNGLSGFLDDKRSLREKVLEEIGEEVGIKKTDIISIKPGQIFDQEEPKHKKTWIVHPVLVKIKTDKIKTDWEAQDYRWIIPADTKKYKLMPGFDLVLKKVFN